MNNDFADIRIDEFFEEIKNKMMGGSIFGKEITEYDIKTMVVAAYLLGNGSFWRIPKTSMKLTDE